MNIAVIGTGYVGLVTGTCFAETGNRVVCVDIDAEKVQKLRQGELPIYEPGLEAIFRRNLRGGRLHFTTSYEEAIPQADIVFLALPTPSDGDGSADLKYVLQAAETLGPLLRGYTVVVNKSTVPVGTAEKVRQVLSKYVDETQFDVVSNPEFLREGVAVNDFMRPDRVVIGTRSERARQLMKKLYAPFVRQGNPILFMDERSAEMTKYAANAYLATRISFMNEIANLCERLGANVDWVRRGMGSDSRIGKRFLFPGVGFGGSCFPKDVRALRHMAREVGYDFKIIDAVIDVNARQKSLLGQKIKAFFGGALAGRKIAIWGLSFKPETDDIREAPSLELIDFLLSEGAQVHVYDPEAMANVEKVYGDALHYGSDMYEILRDAEALAIVTEWQVFRTPDFNRMLELMRTPAIFDGRNIYDVDEIKKMRFHYESIGRVPVRRDTSPKSVDDE